MTHSKSLRVIGQSLEVAKVEAFELEKDGQGYILRSDSLTKSGEWILRNALTTNDFSEHSGRESAANQSLHFSPIDISRLDTEAQKHKRTESSSYMQGASKLSQLLRALGDHLDRTEVSTFRIFWIPSYVSVDYQGPDGQNDCRTFTNEKLQRLGSHSRFRRSGVYVRYGFSVQKTIQVSDKIDTSPPANRSVREFKAFEARLRRDLNGQKE